ncbi:hypothetical protein [Sorangium sp. So ce388]|uniref:hypothetical protein n=1 Tax=Sorangium sp. So ce388 TaxID=3133309 RepID=UPI003F5B1B72
MRITIEPAGVDADPATTAAAALDFLRQAGRVVCDASAESDTATLRRVMRLVESARVALAEEPAHAPAPAPLRSAEEIAREMVTVEYDKDTGAHYAVIWDRKADVEVCLGDASTEAGARDEAKTAEGILRRVLEQGREEGAAAERERVARLVLCDSTPLSRRSIVSAIRALEPRHEQPRDLAGRIRALVQEYAGRWADTDLSDTTSRLALREILDTLRLALLDARAGILPISRVAYMCEQLWGPGRLLVEQAADDLERIVRECEAQR